MAIFTPHPVQALTYVILLVATIICGLGFLLVAHEESDQALRLAAITDPLTKLDNRRRFNEVLNNEFYRLKRSGAPLSLIMIDVDHFKLFNDRYGHVQGDECLRRVGQAIKRAVSRASDAAARFGGEEFVVVAPETDTAGALALAENIRQALVGLAIPHDGNSAASCVTASLGVVTRYVSELKTPEALVDLADQALYRAKQAGRNRTEVMRRLEGEISKGPGLVQLVWNDVAESGNAALDEQHKELFEQANVLLSAVVEGLPRLECKSLLNQMLEALVAHFEFEEAIIRNTSFTHIEHHIQCHKALVAKAHELSDRFDRNELAVGELFSFLANKVVAQHILSEDRKFFPYLRHSL
ncbi:MAG: diguanylate cyclase [Propionivibrio sp.]|nr:diguanylate cyclase [Propionivibrio sp.]